MKIKTEKAITLDKILELESYFRTGLSVAEEKEMRAIALGRWREAEKMQPDVERWRIAHTLTRYLCQHWDE